VNLQLANVPLRLLKTLAAVPVSEGCLSGTLVGNTGRSALSLDAHLSVADLRLGNVPADTGALAAQLTAAWDRCELNADLGISGPFEPNIKARLRVPTILPASTNEAATGLTSSLPLVNADAAVDAQRRNNSSDLLRATSLSALGKQCVMEHGCLEYSMASVAVFSPTWLRSQSTPTRFISAITSSPNPVRPLSFASR
jgi:hypothetical protein